MNRRIFFRNAALAGSGLFLGRAYASSRKQMKITGANIYQVSVGGRYPVIVELLTDSGIRGIGEAAVAYGAGAMAAAAMIK